MKLTVDFSSLRECVREMGATEVIIVLDPPAPPPSPPDLDAPAIDKPGGIPIDPQDIQVVAGMLSYKGYQVVVYIPDHSYVGVRNVQSGVAKANKYHFAECSTIEDMKRGGRYEKRYSALQNPNGLFRITDQEYRQGVDVELLPCINCLKHLNYKGYKTRPEKRKEIFNSFQLKELFSTYSTVFKHLPSEHIAQGGYSHDWPQISRQYRQAKHHICEACGVNLQDHKHLLHVHHINGDKQDNSTKNLKALCFDCHRKEPHHEHMLISHEQMRVIMQARRQQGLLQLNEQWSKAFLMADQAVHGLLYQYHAKKQAVPEVGYAIKNANQDIVSVLELAWPQQRKGVAISPKDVKAANDLGWKVLSLDEAFRFLF